MYFKLFDELKTYIDEVKLKPNEQFMILTGEKSSPYIDELINDLNSRNIKFFGGIYPRLLVGNLCLAEGFVVEKFEPIYSSIVLPYLMRFKLAPSEIENCTALMLVDGLTDRMRELTDTVYSKLGNNVKYIGGGAGFYDLKHRPCIYDNNGFHEDALYVCILKSNTELAVKHGWQKLDGPYVVTESKDNTLSALDGYNAFDVYRDVIEDAERITLYKEEFFLYAKDHPFGIIEKGQTDLVVRDPIALKDNNDIVCVADVPKDSDLYVLKGNIDTLLSSSLEIAKYCAAKAPDKYLPLLFDCISRAMFMEGRFNEELANIQNKLNYEVEGALSIGEIASGNNGKIIIHNKSTILGLLETI